MDSYFMNYSCIEFESLTCEREKKLSLLRLLRKLAVEVNSQAVVNDAMLTGM